MRTPQRLSSVAATLAVAALLLSCSKSSRTEGGPVGALREPVMPTAPSTVAPAVAGFRSSRSYPLVAKPVHITIPSIGVSSDLEELHTDPDGSIQVPTSWNEAGWWADGAKPGQAGPAVILGHVDSTSGPAVFYRLATLRAGDQIKVTGADSSVITFVVDHLETVPKEHFPTDAVYLPTLQPSLRLITCGGEFDTSNGHYRDNVLVFADPA